MSSKIKKVKSVWSSDENTVNRYGKGFHWVESIIVMQAINKKISGDALVGWLAYVCDKYLKQARGAYIGLSLGCGVGDLERQVQHQSIFRKLDAFDIADEAIKQAKKVSHKEKLEINYQVVNLNRLQLKKMTYDVIFANSVLHHLKNLEHVINQMEEALVEDGLVIINEYIGPSQFQYTVKQISVMNDILNILPEIYRKRVTDPNSLKPLFMPPSEKFMNNNDPSEAIRSSEIVSLLEKNFEVIEHKNFGGTILHMLLQDIVGNFNSEDTKDTSVLNLLIYFEEYLIKSKIISSDFTFMVLKKKNLNLFQKFRQNFL